MHDPEPLTAPPSQLDRIRETLQSPAGTSRPLSYAQNLEDYHLWLAFAGKPTGTYIDIGGGHPIAGQRIVLVLRARLAGHRCRAAGTPCAVAPALRPRDTIVSSLIGAPKRDRQSVRRSTGYHALSTTVESYADKAKGLGVALQSIKLPMVTLAELCASHGIETIDFLKIDVEGAEADVIAGGDWRRYRPKVVVVEAIKPISGEPAWEAWEGALLAQGYRFALFDTLNRFYVAEEHPDILARLPSERAPWDSVKHMYEIGRAGENPAHPDHQLASDLVQGFLARLPLLAPELLASLLNRDGQTCRRRHSAFAETCSRKRQVRMRLGRIACGYDGGQIVEPHRDSSR